MTIPKLTRETILDGSYHRWLRPMLGPGDGLMGDAERKAQIKGFLDSAPDPESIWVFGFGSLIWNPAFHFVEKRTARIYGFHREFCLWLRVGRATPERPGLMLSLKPGGSCAGVAYRVAREAAPTELEVLWRREMLTGTYRPVWTLARTPQGPVHAIAFSSNRKHDRYVPNLHEDQVAHYLASASGPSGRCCEHLFSMVEHLRQLGIRDRRMELLETKVKERNGEV